MIAGLEKGPTLRVDSVSAVLGASLLDVIQPQQTPPLPLPPPDERIVVRLDHLIEEVIGLRADLASRTFTARMVRAWAWLCAQFQR